MTRKKRIKYLNQTQFGGKLKIIPIRKITGLERAARSGDAGFNARSIRFQLNKIRKGKPLVPPTVEKKGRKFAIVDGWHRVRALKRLHITKVKAEVV